MKIHRPEERARGRTGEQTCRSVERNCEGIDDRKEGKERRNKTARNKKEKGKTKVRSQFHRTFPRAWRACVRVAWESRPAGLQFRGREPCASCPAEKAPMYKQTRSLHANSRIYPRATPIVHARRIAKRARSKPVGRGMRDDVRTQPRLLSEHPVFPCTGSRLKGR